MSAIAKINKETPSTVKRLSKELQHPPSTFEILRGKTTSKKCIFIYGNPVTIKQKIISL